MSDGPIAVVNAGAELGGADLSLVPVVAKLAETRRVVVFLPGEGALAERLRGAGAELSSGFELRGALAAASRQYGGTGALRLAAAALPLQVRLALDFRRLRPAIVYCNGFRAQLGATVQARLAGATVVWHVRDFAPPGPIGSVWSRLARRSARTIANSAATGGQPALASVRDRVRVVPNGVDLDLFRPRQSGPAGPATIGMVGHLTPWKGHERFLELLATLQKESPDLRGRIAGAPIYDSADHAAYPERLEAEMRRLGLRESCRIEAVSVERMPGWLAELTLLVHCPERPEPFGRALVEAMAVGVPVVSAGGGGAPEVLGDAGVTVEQGEKQALTKAVAALLDDPDAQARLSAAGTARARERFDESVCAARVAEEVLAAG